MVEVAALLATIVAFLWAIADAPRDSACPRGWWIPEGVHRSGEFVCRPAPVGDTERDVRGVLHDRSVQPPGAIHLRVYCANDEQPTIGDDGLTVACRVAR